MKKRFLCMTVMMVVLLGFGTMAWAGEASVFDTIQKILVRVFTTPNPDGTHSAYLEARDETGMRFAGDQLTVTKLNGTSKTYDAETAEGPLKDTFLIHGPSNYPLTTPDVSLSFDTNGGQNGYVYLFCTDNNPIHDMDGDGTPDAHLMKFLVALNGAQPVGDCGSSDGGAFYSQPTANLCSAGTPSSVTGSGPWYWTCTDTGGSENCSANKKVDGACGSSNGGTFTSAPTTNLCSAGTATTVTGSGPWNWSCNGSNGGSNATNCSANLQNPGSGLPDFAKPTVGGLASSYELGYTYNVNVTLRNEGTASAGPSTLKVYQNTTSTPGGTLLYEQAVGALAPGQSTNISFVMSPRSTCSIHVYCKFIFVADANNVVVESDESDNIYVRSMLRAR